MAFTYAELLNNIADAEERLAAVTTEFEYEMVISELEELYVQRDRYDIDSVGEEGDPLADIRTSGF